MPSSAAVLGIALTVLSGICNGLFTVPMKRIPRWKWEHIWLVFMVVACLAMPPVLVWTTVGNPLPVIGAAPVSAVWAAAVFGFIWGFGSILFGLSVDALGVSLANSLVIGLSSAAGSVVPLILQGRVEAGPQQAVLLAGVAAFLGGVAFCGAAGWARDGAVRRPSLFGYAAAVGSGTISAIFNVGYSLAQPIAEAGERLGHSRFGSTNCIWLLMLGAGALPSMVYCSMLMARHRNAHLLADPQPRRTWGAATVMGLLWGGSVFLYGAATPLLGDIGPSIGWPLSLAVAVVVVNVMGIRLGEWRGAPAGAVRRFRTGLALLLAAVALCAVSGNLGG